MESIEFSMPMPLTNNHKQALEFDKANGNTLWEESIKKELDQIIDYKTFKILEAGSQPPKDHTYVSLTLLFVVKHDGRHKARLVAGGDLIDPATEDVYSCGRARRYQPSDIFS